MRTERRHELQTNALADWIGSKTQQVQPYSRVVVGAVIAVAVVIFAIGYRARTNSAARAAGWEELYAAMISRDLEELRHVHEKHADSEIGLWALQVTGDTLLNQGVVQLYEDREEADENLSLAHSNFELVTRKARDPMLQQRALYGLAQTHEARNEMDQAEKKYAELVKSWPDSWLGRSAHLRLDALHDREVQDFYAWFFEQKPPDTSVVPQGLSSFGEFPAGPTIQNDASDEFKQDFLDREPAGNETASDLDILNELKEQSDVSDSPEGSSGTPAPPSESSQPTPTSDPVPESEEPAGDSDPSSSDDSASENGGS